MTTPSLLARRRAAMALAFAAVALCAPRALAQTRETASGRNPSGAAASVNIFADMAFEVTEAMLASRAFERILANIDRPRIVVGNVVNRTSDELLPTGDIARRISEVLVESGLVRWFEAGADRFDLIASPLLSETLLQDGRRREYRMTLTLTLSDVHGEVHGRWSADRTYTR